jgi:hypothetical protein
MPGSVEIGTFFGELLGRTVEATEPKKLHDLKAEDTVWYTGVFIEDDERVSGAFITDLNLACRAGASLAMIPKPVAEEAIKAGELTDGLRENVSEVANIGSALLNGEVFPHLRMRDYVDGIPDEVQDLIVKASGRKDLDVSIEEYGTGLLVLLAR